MILNIKMITFNKRIKEIEEKSKNFRNIREFYKAHPYLYRWSLKHNIELRKYFPPRNIKCKYDDRENKGIDCYLSESGKFYKHYAFVMDALRELDLTYYYVNRVLNGEIDSINGYTFKNCN